MNPKLESMTSQPEQLGALSEVGGSAPSYAEVLKALDDLHIVCECATNPEVDAWYRQDVFAKEARANAIAVLCRSRNPAKLQPEETEVEVGSPASIAKRLRWLSHRMQSVGAEMEYYGGFGEIGEHGREMQGAASIALGWAKGIEASLPNVAVSNSGKKTKE